MASKSLQQEPEKVDLEEMLELIDKTLDRVKSLYEQYFLGIQKQPPTFLHTDLERKLRDLGQVQIRNTALRYRFVTIQQKFGSYHAYWRRTLRQIENGTYVRSLHKLGRKAAQTGEEIPEEILAAMPKRMREQVRRDREAALANAARRHQLPVDNGDGDFYDEYVTPSPKVDARGAHVLSDADADVDLDAFFKQVEDETEATHAGPPPQPPSDLDQFENIVTPPRATPTPPPFAAAVPSAPAPVRAGALGFGPRPTTSPNLRTPSTGTPVVTPPPFAPVGANTPPSFRPSPTPPTSRPAFRPVDTQPGTGATSPPTRSSTEPGPHQPTTGRVIPPTQAATAPSASTTGRVSAPAISPTTGRISAPAIPQPPSASRPGSLPAIPQPPKSGMTDPNQPVVGARPLGRPASVEPPRTFAPSQVTRPNPVAAGAAATTKPTSVETMAGPFAREPSTMVPPRRTKRDTDLDGGGGAVDVPMEPTPRPSEPVKVPRPVTAPTARPTAARSTPTPNAARPPTQQTPSRPSQPVKRPPPGMTDDDVNNLYAKYVKAKEMVGETTGPQTYGKLLNTINAQAPKIMEQYNAKGVDFSVVVKDNQVIIRAKPKP